MVDVTVRGAGIFGLSVAWACLLKGARVQIIDPVGVAAGASGGIVGALAPHTPEKWNEKKAFQLESLLMADRFWSEVEDRGGQSSGFARTGRIQPVGNERGLELARSRQTGADKYWRGRATWTLEPAHDGWAPVSPTGYLVKDTLSGRIYPRRACEALAAAIISLGGSVAADATDQGAVVWACGAEGLRMLSRELDKDIGRGEKGQAALLRLRAPPPAGAQQIFANSVHIVPHYDGTVAVGSTSERAIDAPESTDDQLERLIATAIMAVPALDGADVIQRWAGVRPRAATRAPVLGAHPVKPDHFIANGGFKIGFGMAPKVAEVMADLVLDGVDGIPADFNIAASL